MTQQHETMVVKLYGAVTELEQAIGRARASMSQMQNVPSGVIVRLSSYDGILVNQRRYIHELSEHVKKENMPEIARLVNLINQLSSMIKDDVRLVLTSLSQQQQAPKKNYEDEMNFC